MKVVKILFSNLRVVLLALLLLTSSTSFSQGLINNGAYITITSGAYIYVAGGSAIGNLTNQDAGASVGTIANSGTIDITGDWINNSTSNVFSSNAGTVELLGSNNQNIKGSTTTWFNNLTLKGTGTKTLDINTLTGGGYASPAGVLALNDRPMALNTHTLEVNNPATTAITRSSGYIISEMNAANNTSIIKWNVGATNGAYLFPFGTASGTYIPFTLTKSAGNTSIYLSTRANAANDNLPWQTSVTNMYSTVVGGNGAIPVVIDRWWDIYSASTFTASASFTYRGIENTTTYNPTGTFAAQNWSGAIWFSPVGNGPGVTTGTAAVNIPSQVMGGTIATPWVLSNIQAPLPVELLSFTTRIKNRVVEIDWATASEINSDFFVAEKSVSGDDYETVGRIAAAGNSTSILKYSLADNSPFIGLSYYRLKQVDKDGSFTYSAPVAIYINNDQQLDFVSAFVDNNSRANLVFTNHLPEKCNIILYDMLGKELYREQIQSASGINNYGINMLDYSHGIYYITISNSGKNSSKKIVY